MILSYTKAERLYTKEIDFPAGIIHILKFHTDKRTRPGTVERKLSLLEKLLKKTNSSTATLFIPIDSDIYSTKKIKCIDREDEPTDYHFNIIFNTSALKVNYLYQLQEGVSEWTMDKFNEQENEMFDVIKKRKAMDAAPPSSTTDSDSPAALAAFEEFEHSVLPALERIRVSDDAHRRQELLDMDDIIAKGIAIPASGGVYFAWSDCLNCMKIGATRRETPEPRLRELSLCVTSPFRLAAWMPTLTPFRLEVQAHAFFGSRRIREAGAGTEFFRIGDAEAQAYVAERDGN